LHLVGLFHYDFVTVLIRHLPCHTNECRNT